MAFVDVMQSSESHVLSLLMMIFMKLLNFNFKINKNGSDQQKEEKPRPTSKEKTKKEEGSIVVNHLVHAIKTDGGGRTKAYNSCK